MSIIKNKKILYIGVSTFNYEKEVKSGLESMGAIVDYYDERPGNGFLIKVLLRLKLNFLIKFIINSYYSKIMEKIKNKKYDYVLIIKLETIDDGILSELKECQKSAIFILYLWDAINNYKGKEKLLKKFDKAFTFDSVDAVKYDELTFLPLFYIPLYGKKLTDNIKYDLCFIGTGHTDRYLLVKLIKSRASEFNLRFYSFLFLQHKLLFVFRKLFDNRIKFSKMNEFSYASMSQYQVYEKISQSRIIVDIEHQGQNGLTMRTIEAIGCKKKIITTNKCIRNYDFYDENNVHIIDREMPTIDERFFITPYRNLDKEIYKKYSLKNWLVTIFTHDTL